MFSWRKTLWRAAALAAAGSAVGLVHNRFSPEGIGLREHPLQATAQLDGSSFLNLDEARAKWEAGVAFLDARAEDFYLAGHIRRALSLPISDFESAFARVEGEFPPKEQELVCYCSGFGCEESVELAQRLIERGYARVFVYLGGWPEWSEAGLPVDAVEAPE